MKRLSLPQVDCSDCNGSCCRHMRTPPHMVFLTEENKFRPHKGFFGDFSLLMKAPEEARQVFLAGLYAPLSERPDESPCSWLDLETGRCRWHEYRPEICRSFNVGSDSCRAARLEHGVDKPALWPVNLSALFHEAPNG